MADNDTKRFSADEIEAMNAAKDYTPTRPDAPTIEPDEAFWQGATVHEPENKVPVSVRIDADVLAWFKSHGRGYQTKMNAVLRAYVDAHR